MPGALPSAVVRTSSQSDLQTTQKKKKKKNALEIIKANIKYGHDTNITKVMSATALLKGGCTLGSTLPLTAPSSSGSLCTFRHASRSGVRTPGRRSVTSFFEPMARQAPGRGRPAQARVRGSRDQGSGEPVLANGVHNSVQATYSIL